MPAPGRDASEGAIFVDLHGTLNLMIGYLVQAAVNRGVLTTNDEELRETAEGAIGGIVSYILTYVKSRTKPVITYEQSAMMRLAERLSSVFSSQEEAARALHEVESLLLEEITCALDEGNNFDIVDYSLNQHSLVIFIRNFPPALLGRSPTVQPLFKHINDIPVMAPALSKDFDTWAKSVYNHSDDEAAKHWDTVNVIVKSYVPPDHPRRDEFGEGFIVDISIPEELLPPNFVLYPNEPKQVPPEDDDIIPLTSF